MSVDPIRYTLVSVDLQDRDEDMIAIPRWMLGVLAGELAAASGCGGEHAEPDCPVCKSIRTAKEASECGIEQR